MKATTEVGLVLRSRALMQRGGGGIIIHPLTPEDSRAPQPKGGPEGGRNHRDERTAAGRLDAEAGVLTRLTSENVDGLDQNIFMKSMCTLRMDQVSGAILESLEEEGGREGEQELITDQSLLQQHKVKKVRATFSFVEITK